MRTKWIDCPICGTEWEEPVEFEEADPSVGIMGPAAFLLDDLSCPECKHIFGDDERQKKEEQILDAELYDDPY